MSSNLSEFLISVRLHILFSLCVILEYTGNESTFSFSVAYCLHQHLKTKTLSFSSVCCFAVCVYFLASG
ncbi:hypothetical protein F5Y06DRAFT_270024 [Hypoxylon sp. FL0890]|nr:hypothetical protein F5Y06DRAFT_270024 [Hypoxylon sp. FL0890]